MSNHTSMSSEQENSDKISSPVLELESPKLYTPTILETKTSDVSERRWSVQSIKEKFESFTKNNKSSKDDLLNSPVNNPNRKSFFQYAKEKLYKESPKDQPALKRQQSEHWTTLGKGDLKRENTYERRQSIKTVPQIQIPTAEKDEDFLVVEGEEIIQSIESPKEIEKSPKLWLQQKLEKKDDYSYVNVDTVKWNENPLETEYLQAIEESIEEFLNPFWEECIYNSNPLYEDDVIYENPLHEESFVTFNLLFTEPSKEIPYYHQGRFNFNDEKLVESMKSFLKLQNSDVMIFTGFQVCQFIKEKYGNGITQEDVPIIAQQFMDFFIFKDVYLRNRKFIENSNYLFFEDIESIDTNHINNTFGSYQNKYIPKPEIYRTLRNLDNCLKMICDNFIKIVPYQYIKINKNIGYNTLWKSEQFKELKKYVINLQKIDPKELKGDRQLSFCINLYNIMMLHGLFKIEDKNDLLEKEKYFKENYYLIGNYQIDINQLKNNILLGKSRSSRYKEYTPHQDLSLNFDPRIHFALHDATISSPILRDYCEENIDKQLKEATKYFIRTEVEIDDKNSTIVLPQIFQEYQVDFGDDLQETFEFISKYYPKKDREDFMKKTTTYEVSYKLKDNKMNQKSKEEEIQGFDIKYEEIAQNIELRQSFRKFCEQEASTENIDCWEEILEFKKIEDPQERYRVGEEIYEKYIGPNATQPVNISKKSIVKVRNEIEAERNSIQKDQNYTPNVQITLYDNIQKLIDIVMVDSFTRYKFSDVYFQYVEKYIDKIMMKKDEDTQEKKKKKRKSQSILLK